MSVYESNATMGDLARRLDAARRVLLTTHEKPDGDALGSVVALHRALAARGRDPEIWLAGPVDRGLDTVLDGTPVRRLEDGAPGDDHDLAVVADTGAWSQLRTIAPWLRRHHERVIGLDHHRLGDDVAAWRVVDPACAATTQLVVRLLDELGWEITGGPGGLAEPLFAGLATDTGWFRYSNADADAFAVAARLLACGVDNSRLHQRIEETHAPSRLGLEARALASLAYAADGTVAVMSLARADFDATGGTPADLTSIVNRPMVVARVRASALLVETGPASTKVSLRSKPALAADDRALDVNVFAQRFGGGGHTHAAGARIELALDEARRTLIEALDAAAKPGTGTDSARAGGDAGAGNR